MATKRVMSAPIDGEDPASSVGSPSRIATADSDVGQMEVPMDTSGLGMPPAPGKLFKYRKSPLAAGQAGAGVQSPAQLDPDHEMDASTRPYASKDPYPTPSPSQNPICQGLEIAHPAAPSEAPSPSSAQYLQPTRSSAPPSPAPIPSHPKFSGSTSPSAHPCLTAAASPSTDPESSQPSQTLFSPTDWPSHPRHPRNWPRSRKWRITITVALTGFISTLGSSIAVPGVHAIMADFGVESAKVGVLITTFYVLGMGAGPFLFAPISELYGRQVAYLSSQICFFIFCIGSATVHNMPGLIAIRFFCGVFASSGPALGVATCADMWAPEERGGPVGWYGLGPIAGPIVGGMIGYWILPSGWRFLFWTITIMAGANTVLFVISAAETNAEVLAKKLQYRHTHPLSGSSPSPSSPSPPPAPPTPTVTVQHHSPSTHSLPAPAPPTPSTRLARPASIIFTRFAWLSSIVSAREASLVFQRTFSRPFRLLFTNPVCAMFCLYYSYIYALIYLFLVAIPLLHGQAPFARAGLFSYSWALHVLPASYVGLAIGFFSAVVTASRVQDKIYVRLKERNGGKGQPEYRLLTTQLGMITMPIGLLIWGWTAEYQTHWMGPQVGAAIIGFGLMLAFNSIQNFLVDAFFPYSAAAIAAATACRSIMTSVLPVLAGDMFENLGWGKGGTLLACIALVAVPAPALMFRHGRTLREKYAFTG